MNFEKLLVNVLSSYFYVSLSCMVVLRLQNSRYFSQNQ